MWSLQPCSPPHFSGVSAVCSVSYLIDLQGFSVHSSLRFRKDPFCYENTSECICFGTQRSFSDTHQEVLLFALH